MLKRTVLAVASYTVGVESRVKDIDLWLKDPADTSVGVINRMRGIGKTTIAKVADNLNFADFDASSFLANIREASEQQYGLVRLQSQLLSDISKGKKQKIYNPDEGIIKIQAALCRKRILVILDDVDHNEQIDALIGAGDSFLEGSKIIITTSRKRLLSYQNHKTFCIKQLDDNESLQLFCWHAFSRDSPIQEYSEHSERVVQHCEGHPLALHLMGSSLLGRNLEFWVTDLQKIKGKDIDVVELFGEKNYYSKIGMQNLKDRYLVSVDKDNMLVMHPLVRDMATTIIRQENIDNPGKHNLCNSTGTITETVTSEESLLCKNDICGKRKRLDDFEDELMAPNGEGSSLFKSLCLGFSSLFEPATRKTKRLTMPHG